MSGDTSAGSSTGAPASNSDELTSDATPARTPGPAVPWTGRLGRYHVLEQLGAGGMGVVFAAYDPDLDRKVALKLLRPDGSSGSPGRLLREALALARLSHPNVVQVHDTGAIDGQIFIAMELVRGVDLRTWLAAPRPLAEVLRVFLDAGRGLAAAHEAGFVHRDFKPENVLLGHDGRARVADFGLVRQHDEPPVDPPTQPGRGALARSLTLTGAVLGTPAYMAPEQHLGGTADARSDQFSYCVALWEALHGQRPFAGDSTGAIVAAMRAGQLRAGPRRVPGELTRLLTRGLAFAPEKRHPSMQALLTALARDPARTRRRWLVGLGTAGLLVGAFAALRGEAEPCGGGPEALMSTWNPTRRQAVAEVLAAAPDRELPALALAGLDAYAAAWLASHRDACLDHRRGEQSSALLDARMLCLDRRRQSLAAAARLLAGDDPGSSEALASREATRTAGDAPSDPAGVATVGSSDSRGAAGAGSSDSAGTGARISSQDTAGPDAAQVVARLPAIGACDDPAVVLSEAAVPEDPGLAGEVAAIASLLITARVRHDSGDFAGARAVADDAVSQARRAQFEPILAEALLTLARIHISASDWDLAGPALAEASTRAVEARRDDLAAEAIARRLYVDVIESGRAAEALRLAPLVLAMAARAPEPHAARALAHNNISVAQVMAHDREGAAASMEHAVEEMQAAPRIDPIEQANMTLNAAVMTAEPELRRARLHRARASIAEHLGPSHPLSLDLQEFAAWFEPVLRDGKTQLDGVCPQYLSRRGGALINCSFCFHRLAHFQRFLGEPAQALASAEKMLACRVDRAAIAQDGHMRAKARAFIAIHTGRPLAALESVKQARVWPDSLPDAAWMDGERAELALLRGRALLELGRPVEAAEALEQALPTLTASVADRPDLLPALLLAEAQMLLARALRAASPPDEPRAATLTAAAEASLAALGAVVP